MVHGSICAQNIDVRRPGRPSGIRAAVIARVRDSRNNVGGRERRRVGRDSSTHIDSIARVRLWLIA